MNAQDCCVLIPSLEPDEKLKKYVKELLEGGFGLILVINDGSSDAYRPIFDQIASWERCTVLTHDENRGKGAALRTGFQYILDSTPFKGVITADSDGQHTVVDALNLASLLDENVSELLLGSRDFSRKSKKVPTKSRLGNRITSVIYCLLYGHWLPDTQTGLRALNRSMLPDALQIKGDRFEYEMNQLIHCAGLHTKMRVVPIETVYLNENKGTHFHPLRDSWRIYKLLLTGFIKFMSASFAATLIDLFLFTVLNRYILEAVMPDATFHFLFWTLSSRFLVATGVARICSATINFLLNKNFVFNLQKCRGAVLRYVILCVCVMSVSALSVSLLSEWFGVVDTSLLNTLIKAVVDTVLFMINFRIQKSWVFAQKAKPAKQGVIAK